MGKYDYTTEHFTPSAELQLKTAIANELAEANRLERLKLKIEHFPTEPYSPPPPPCDEKELEDQA